MYKRQQFACKNFKGNDGQTDIAKTIGFESNEEYNEFMFLREITHTINFSKSMHYNPFAYLRTEKDILKLVPL